MAAYDRDEEEPLDPAAERLRRKMVRLLIVSGGIMMLGLIAVFAAIVYKLGMLGPGDAATTAFRDPFGAAVVQAPIALPPGARLLSADLDGNRALLTVEADGASTLILLDLATGKTLGRYALMPE
jgi:hypothetical protein